MMCPRCGCSDGRHVGYHEDAELPIKRGDRVRIRAGAEIWTTLPDPAKKRFSLKRARVVTVHSMDCGSTVSVTLYGDESHKQRVRELEKALAQENSPEKRTQMQQELSDLARGLLHIQPPGVCWVGTGGYWHHAKLEDVDFIKETDNG